MLSQIQRAIDWKSPTTGSPDYFNACCTSTPQWWYPGVPANYFGSQNVVLNENGYAGTYAFINANQTYREYIQAKLTSTLIANQKYFVSFYVSLSDSSVFATDDFGAYLSPNPINLGTFGAFGFTPQVANSQGQFLNNKIGWKKISGSFIAVGNEQYITIGNFKDDSGTDTLRLLPNNNWMGDYNSAYYYIDKVCVSTDSLMNNIIEGINESKNLSLILIYPNPATDYINIKSSYSSEIKSLILKDNYGHVLRKSCDLPIDKIDITNLSDGIYFLELFLDNKKYFDKIVIKH